MTFGQYRGEDEWRRCTRRRGRRDLRDDLGADPVPHLVAICGSNCDARERNWRARSACSGRSPDS